MDAAGESPRATAQPSPRATAQPWQVVGERMILTALVALVALTWVPALFRNQWLDEGITDWVARSESFSLLWERVREYQVGSAYFVVPWLVFRVVPDAGEALLRLPSMVAVFGAAAVVAAIGARLLSREAGGYMALFLVLQGSVMDAAVNARAYALGLFLVSASLLFLLRWLDRARGWDGVGFALFAGAAVHVHLLLAVTVAAQAAYALGSRRVPLRQLVWVALLGALVGAPAVSVFLQTLGRRALYDWAPTPGLLDLSSALLPPWTFLGMAAGLLVARAAGPSVVEAPPGVWRSHLAGLALCWLGPVLALFAVSQVSSNLFEPRYLIGTMPAAAVLLGLAVCQFASPGVRIALGAGPALLVSALLYPLPPRECPDPSATIARLEPRPGTPVLYRSGLIESQDPRWLEDPLRRDYFLAGTVRHPIPGEVILLPYLPGPDQQEYLEAHVLPELARADRFLIVGVAPRLYEEWTREALGRDFELGLEADALWGQRRPTGP